MQKKRQDVSITPQNSRKSSYAGPLSVTKTPTLQNICSNLGLTPEKQEKSDRLSEGTHANPSALTVLHPTEGDHSLRLENHSGASHNEASTKIGSAGGPSFDSLQPSGGKCEDPAAQKIEDPCGELFEDQCTYECEVCGQIFDELSAAETHEEACRLHAQTTASGREEVQNKGALQDDLLKAGSQDADLFSIDSASNVLSPVRPSEYTTGIARHILHAKRSRHLSLEASLKASKLSEIFADLDAL